MTLMKSLLLGSAAGIVAVASAQAADLPTRKAAPVEYVRVCNVGGITGWTLPGSDTCVKFSGYLTAQFEGGNLTTQYNYGSIGEAADAAANPLVPQSAAVAAALAGISGLDSRFTQRVLIQASAAQGNTTFYRHQTGWTTRANFGFDLASNTAYGPLIAHFDLNSENGNGFDNTGNNTYLNTGYVTWAGITAGKAQSFYSFVGGGDNWANFASPDQKGFNEPDLLAYTASFGGGFTATIAAQSPGSNGSSGGGTDIAGPGGLNTSLHYGGQRWPDFVGALHVKQGWGEAQLSGVIHNVNVVDPAYANAPFNTPGVLNNGAGCGVTAALETGILPCNAYHNQIGWGIDAGVKVNLPSFGAGDDALITGSYTQSAVLYSGLLDMMWGENGQVNGNGQPMYLADAFFNPITNQWSKPTAWSVSALIEHHFTPQFYLDLEGSVGQLKWSNMGGGCTILGFGCGIAQFANGPISPSATTWLVGADLGWNPVTNLNFDLELMYQSTNQSAPSGFLGTVYNWGQANEFFVPGNWHGVSDGFAGRFRITRYF
ncbi:MAG TPA: porin [Roseiarcus sp.]|nr:porin [Roseiarcus sp.]